MDAFRCRRSGCGDLLQYAGSADRGNAGLAALGCLEQKKYHLILLDIMMPDLDGFGVLEELRKTDAHTPVIFLTARADEVGEGESRKSRKDTKGP
jgi:two-component system alkaline phosphatase synthesis response regulator PhoP